MAKVEITFYPDGKTVQVEKGITVSEAASEAGVYIASICGGEGICGKCRVIIKGGEVDAAPTTLLTRDEVQKGYVLACQTKVIGDVEVEIPPEARAEGAQILIDEDAQRFRALLPTTEEISFEHAPLVQKLYLDLPKPDLQDNLADHQRLYRGIRRHREAPVMQTGLKVLRILPRLLREDQWKVTTTLGIRGETTEVIQVEEGDTTENSYGIAVDVGTSTVVAHLIDLNCSKTVDAEACYNSQRSYGEEVTRRIIYADQNGPEELREAIVNDINNLISALILRNKVELNDIIAVLCSGNTTMLHFLLGLDPSQIRKSPYIPASTSPPPIRAAEVGIKINKRGLLYTMPSIGSWVGGDITAGVLATGINRSEALTMLIDIGTNGEILLGNKEWMICCSASAGPAFEGSGVTSGMRASRGAIERVDITPEEEIKYSTIGDERPKGICGSGLIDSIAELFKTGYIDRSGRLLLNSSPRVRDRDGQLEFVLVSNKETERGGEIIITQPDIENLIRAKAAIYAGAKILAQSMDLEFDDIEQIYLAGGFGNYLDREKAVMLGLIPDVPLGRIRFVGNTSIMGAKMALLSKEAHTISQRIAKNITYYDLISYPYYYDEFISAKFIPHTDLDRFPSVAKKLAVGLGLQRKERSS